MRMKTRDKHTSTNPTLGDRVWSLNVPLPVAVIAPNKHKNKPGQPHKTAATRVAMMPVFLFMVLLLIEEMNLFEYITKTNRAQAVLAPCLHANHVSDASL
jgi:hypothetical protein